jgi:hypothetical protein
MSQYDLAIYIKKDLEGKPRICETQIFHLAKIYNLKKNPLKETKIFQNIYNSIINLKFQHKPK